MLKFLNGKSGWFAAFGLLVSSQAFAYPGGWTAIVFDRDGHFGSYHGAYSKDEAVQSALSLATSLTGPYKFTFAYNGWVALGKCNGDNSVHWAGDHSSQYASEMDALKHCGTYQASDGNYYPNGYIIRSLSAFDFQPDQDGTRPADATPFNF
jgi:hypothetical protein